MKICILIKTLGLGGAERHVADLSRELVRRGHTVSVIYTMKTKLNVLADLNVGGALVHRLEASNAPMRLWQLASILRAERPDVVHAHSPLLKVMARVLRPFLGYRLISTYHNVFPRHSLAIRVIERLLHRLDDVQISCAQEVAASMPWPTRNVPNGITLQREKRPLEGPSLRDRFDIPTDVPVFVCVATLTKKKNHERLIDAFSLAFPDGMAARLVLYGDGPNRSKIADQISSAGFSDAIILAGSDPDARHLITEADAFCLVSLFEGLPLALLEAMASGLPCVVSRAGEMAKVVIHEETGIVVDSDDTTGIASALQRLAADPDLRRRMGAASLSRVQSEFGLDGMVDRLEDAYRGSASNRPLH